jgi:hypothetical protein
LELRLHGLERQADLVFEVGHHLLFNKIWPRVMFCQVVLKLRE